MTAGMSVESSDSGGSQNCLAAWRLALTRRIGRTAMTSRSARVETETAACTKLQKTNIRRRHDGGGRVRGIHSTAAVVRYKEAPMTARYKSSLCAEQNRPKYRREHASSAQRQTICLVIF
jgi:hypothetical protein